MKLVTKLLGASILASFATSAFALTIPAGWNASTDDLRITGATAYRSSVHTTITTILNPGFQFAHNGSDLGKSTQAIWAGTLVSNGQPIVIRTSWSGSLGGVGALTTGNNVAWLDTTVAAGSGAAAGTVALPANLAFSDSSQASCALVQSALASPSLTPYRVGVIPFRWVASEGSPLTNASDNALIATLIGKGRQGLYTGESLASAPGNAGIYMVGRNNESGTRVSAFSVTGFGVANTPYQFDVIEGTAGTVASATPYDGTGEQGYSSGGTVGAKLALSGANLASITDEYGDPLRNGWFVGYVGLSDANKAITDGAVGLSYNGVAYSTSAVTSGQYTFWSYEYAFKSPLAACALAADASTAADAIIAGCQTTVTSGAILVGAMQVERASESGTVLPKSAF